MTFDQILAKIDDFVWGVPLIVLILAAGLLLTIRTGFIQVRHLPRALRYLFKEEVSEEELKGETDALTALFRKALNNDKLEVKVEKMKDENVASMITLSEESRRMQEMMKMYGMSGMDMGTTSTLILNANHPLVEYVVAHKDGENTEMFCHQLYDLAMLAHKPLSPEEMTEFVKRSNEIMMKLAK